MRSGALLRLLLGGAILTIVAAGGASADGAGEESAERSRPRRDGSVHAPARASAFPPRRVTGGPGYVGSDWGIGKPSFSGIGTRPDRGFSGD